jgi:hypothetical protein
MRWLRRAPALASAALALAGLAGPSRAGDAIAEKRAVILVRALSYDANLPQRVGSDLTIAVLARKGAPASEACSASMRLGFGALSAAKVAGVPVKVTTLWFSSTDALAGAITSQGIDGLYSCEGLESDQPAIVEVARKHQVLTLGGSEEQVTRGLALGVVFVESKPTLFVNLTAAKAAGAALSSDLLRVARVLR